MPQPPAEEPQTKITLNLFTSDVDYLKRTIGHGYTSVIREIIREAVNARRNRPDRVR